MSAILLAGADRAFGSELAARLAADGAHVIPLAAEASAVTTAPGEAFDVLVINVPVTRDATRFVDISDMQLTAALEQMVFDVVAIVQAALPRLGPGARIVVVSARGHLGAWGGAHLMAATAALMGLVRSLALELADRGIRVNALAPDFAGERWDTPSARREVAEAAVFLARDGMTMLSGQALLLDGMRSLRMSESRRQ